MEYSSQVLISHQDKKQAILLEISFEMVFNQREILRNKRNLRTIYVNKGSMKYTLIKAAYAVAFYM